MSGGDATERASIHAHGTSTEAPALLASSFRPVKDILLLPDVAELFALPNPRAALRFLRENSLPLVKLGRRLVVVRAALVEELTKRSRVEDRGAAVAAVVRRLAEGRRRSSILSIPKAPRCTTPPSS
jgi:hypothetical protein